MPVSAVSRSSTSISAATVTLRAGSKGASVQLLQQRLNAHGYNLSVDGDFGPKTKAAVLAFQKKMGLTADGIVGPKTWAKLNAAAEAPRAANPVLKLGARGASVTAMQNRLRAHGYNIANDGAFGPKTQAAVLAFQKAKGLAADGIVGAKTWAALNAAPSAAPAPSGPTTGPTLRQGASGPAVTTLQQRLAGHGISVTADGQFGPKTKAAVIAFQRAKGLAADGVVGPKTWAALGGPSVTGGVTNPGGGSVGGSSALASAARSVALSMGGYNSQGLCAKGVSTAIQRTYGIKVWGNGNDIDNNLPRNKFKQINISLAEALKIPGLVLTWEKTSTRLGSIYGHTAITAGDGHTSYSDFIETNTLAGSSGRSGLKIFMPI